jgi:hypothetical protein
VAFATSERYGAGSRAVREGISLGPDGEPGTPDAEAKEPIDPLARGVAGGDSPAGSLVRLSVARSRRSCVVSFEGDGVKMVSRCVGSSALFAWAFASALVVGCAGPYGSVILYEGPDRPGGEEVEGPAPPSDYNFGPVRRELDLNGDHKRDRIEYLSEGKVNGVGDDTNHDGKMDRYQKIVNGMVLEETRDTNFDGVLDLRSIDTDNDGKLDKDIQLLPPLNMRLVPTPQRM